MIQEAEYRAALTSSPPLLEINDLRLSGSDLLGPDRLITSGTSITCIEGAQSLVLALAKPGEILEGSLSLLGEAPRELLAQGRAGYAPKKLPLPPGTRLEEALLLSAALVGMGRQDVRSVIERCHLNDHRKKRLGDLTRLQERLSGLAHGLCGSPSLLILEDLFLDLEESGAKVIEERLASELASRWWIAAVTPESPQSRRLVMNSDEVLCTAGNRLTRPIAPDGLTSAGFWVHCAGNAEPLISLLREEGAQVSESPRDSMLLVQGLEGLAIFQCAKKAKTPILELSPLTLGIGSTTHARSDA